MVIMAEEKKQEKKLIIDEDWKEKAQKEKEVLKEKEKTEKQDENVSQDQEYQLPAGDFSALVSLLATQAMFAMGFITTEKDKEPKKNLKLAKFNIDMLETLETKTKGNLSDEEQKFLSGTLAQLRMGFVNVSG